jgi:hypothetical protein
VFLGVKMQQKPNKKTSLGARIREEPAKTLAARPRGGPRTAIGKSRTRYNAMKHGIFSQVVLLPGDSRRAYHALLVGLMRSFNPVWEIEKECVDRLATFLWRSRRALAVEVADVRRKIELDPVQDQAEQAAAITQPEIELHGLIAHIENCQIHNECLVLLDQLKKSIEEIGFDIDTDLKILNRIYGSSRGLSGQPTLADRYVDTQKLIAVHKAANEGAPIAPPDDCKVVFLSLIDNERASLKREGRAKQCRAQRRREIEVSRALIPGGEELDRILRYGAAIDRNIDRTISQLLMFRSMRLGIPAPPMVNFDLRQLAVGDGKQQNELHQVSKDL